MIQLSSTPTETNLMPVISATRPLWSRGLETALALFLAFLTIMLGSSFWRLIKNGLGFAETYNDAAPNIRQDVINMLVEGGLIWWIALVLLIGVPAFIHIGFLTLRSTRAISDDRYLTRRALEDIQKKMGPAFISNITDNQVEVLSEKAEPETFAWLDFESVTWLANAAIFRFKNRPGFFFMLLDEAGVTQRKEIEAIVARSGLPTA
jgi:hypothetical protein